MFGFNLPPNNPVRSLWSLRQLPRPLNSCNFESRTWAKDTRSYYDYSYTTKYATNGRERWAESTRRQHLQILVPTNRCSVPWDCLFSARIRWRFRWKTHTWEIQRNNYSILNLCMKKIFTYVYYTYINGKAKSFIYSVVGYIVKRELLVVYRIAQFTSNFHRQDFPSLFENIGVGCQFSLTNFKRRPIIISICVYNISLGTIWKEWQRGPSVDALMVYFRGKTFCVRLAATNSGKF